MLAGKSIGDEEVKNRLLQGKSVVHAAIMVRNAGEFVLRRGIEGLFWGLGTFVSSANFEI
ncbi:hypothetical protein Dimus_035937 [Dionaea muscipula]